MIMTLEHLVLEPGQRGECPAWVEQGDELRVWCELRLDHTGNHRNDYVGVVWNQ